MRRKLLVGVVARGFFNLSLTSNNLRLASYDSNDLSGIIIPASAFVFLFLSTLGRLDTASSANGHLYKFRVRQNAPQGISANYGYQRLKPDLTSLATIDVNALRIDYRYTDGQDTFGIEASAYNRKVTIGQFNDTYRGSMFWTHAFDKPAHAAARPIALAPAQTPMYLPHDINALLDIKPGDDLEITLKRLVVAGFHGGIRQANTIIYEASLLDEIGQRQRFAIEHGAGRVTRVALVVNLDDPDNAQAVSQTYERVRRALLDRFGNPSLNYEEGEIAPTLTADLSAGHLIRTTEWRTGDGTLRLGIPRRLDGQVRIDIQHANRFGAPRDALWSMDAVL